jgi:hypothetical protein
MTDFELVRFRMDPLVLEKAAKVCADHGLELSDVLRTLITTIAREGKVPGAAASAPRRPAEERAPFAEYNESLWSGLRPRLDAELALTVLARFVADTSLRIADAAAADQPDQRLINELTQDRKKALKLQRSLNVADDAAVRDVIATYSPAARRSED